MSFRSASFNSFIDKRKTRFFENFPAVQVFIQNSSTKLSKYFAKSLFRSFHKYVTNSFGGGKVGETLSWFGIYIPMISLVSFGLITQTSAYKRFKKSTKARGIIFQSFYGVKELLSAFGLSFESAALRYMMLSAALVTYATSGMIGQRKRDFRALSTTFVCTNYLLYYYLRVVEYPIVRFHRTFWNVSIVEKAKLLRRPFFPIFWMSNRHLQTVAGSIFADLFWMLRPPVVYDREGVPAHDGNVLFLDWFVNDNLYLDPDLKYGDGLTNFKVGQFLSKTINKVASQIGFGSIDNDRVRAESLSSTDNLRKLNTAAVAEDKFEGEPELLENGLPMDAPIIFAIHGIGGSCHDAYLKRLMTSSAERAWRPVCYSYWRLDWSDPRDLETVIEHVAKRYPKAPLFAVAFSAGGHLLADYLAKVGKHTPVVAAVSVAGCLDFVRTWHYCENQQNVLYQSILTSNFKICVERHRDNDKHIQDRKDEWNQVANNCKRANIMYDRHLVLMNNFTGKHLLKPEIKRRGKDSNWHLGTTPDTAYDRIKTPYPLPQTATHYLNPARIQVDKIAVTFLLMHSRDDPIVSHDDCYDWDRCSSNQNIISLRTVRGGHLGWFDGLLPGMAVTTWGDRVVLDFLSAVLEQHAQTNFLVSVMRKSLALTRPYQLHDGEFNFQSTESQTPNGSTQRRSQPSQFSPRYNIKQGRGGEEEFIQLGGESPRHSNSTLNDSPSPTQDQFYQLSHDHPNNDHYQSQPYHHNQSAPQHLPTHLSPGVFARICSTSDLALPTAVVPTLSQHQRKPSALNLASNIELNLNKAVDDDETLINKNHNHSHENCDEDDCDDNHYHGPNLELYHTQQGSEYQLEQQQLLLQQQEQYEQRQSFQQLRRENDVDDDDDDDENDENDDNALDNANDMKSESHGNNPGNQFQKTIPETLQPGEVVPAVRIRGYYGGSVDSEIYDGGDLATSDSADLEDDSFDETLTF